MSFVVAVVTSVHQKLQHPLFQQYVAFMIEAGVSEFFFSSVFTLPTTLLLSFFAKCQRGYSLFQVTCDMIHISLVAECGGIFTVIPIKAQWQTSYTIVVFGFHKCCLFSIPSFPEIYILPLAYVLAPSSEIQGFVIVTFPSFNKFPQVPKRQQCHCPSPTN